MMKQRVTALLLATVAAANLSACFPLVAGGVAGGALVATDRRTSGAYVEDQGIELKAAQVLRERFAAANVSVTSYNRAVLLTGEVADDAQRSAVELQLRGMPNVRRVYNHLVVAPNATLPQRNGDIWLTTKVRTRLLEGNGYPPNAVKVVSERGVVYLLGLLTPAEGEAAAQVAATTSGVQQVVTLFEPIGQ
ncbi:BON domain-containing protein [Vogesella oryzae]|uniref:BON domain-containing protein n=1 Tax=Vogesella oryzae TaxID=1735285 RepID=UPI001FE389A9|nr:BON domain-containing protein [Vogesella oryzae]